MGAWRREREVSEHPVIGEDGRNNNIMEKIAKNMN
jgi:hypothetical protein